jgi:hypothetical protein
LNIKGLAMKNIKFLIAFLITGTNVFPNSATTSFTGSCFIHTNLVKKTLSNFNLKIGPDSLFPSEEMRFTVPVSIPESLKVEHVEFTVRASMARPVGGQDGTRLQIVSPNSSTLASTGNATRGAILTAAYFIRGGLIECKGSIN